MWTTWSIMSVSAVTKSFSSRTQSETIRCACRTLRVTSLLSCAQRHLRLRATPFSYWPARLTVPRRAGKHNALSMKKRLTPKYRRVLIKLSGEALGDISGCGINPEAIHDMARQIRGVREMGVDVVIVVGGG